MTYSTILTLDVLQIPRLEQIFAKIWFHYSDIHNHKLVGKHAPSADSRALLSRCVAFLRSDLEYEWPEYAWIDPKRIVLRLLGQRYKIEQRFEKFKAAGDFDVWPFLRESDWELWRGIPGQVDRRVDSCLLTTVEVVRTQSGRLQPPKALVQQSHLSEQS